MQEVLKNHGLWLLYNQHVEACEDTYENTLVLLKKEDFQ